MKVVRKKAMPMMPISIECPLMNLFRKSMEGYHYMAVMDTYLGLSFVK